MPMHLALGRERQVIVLDEQHKVHLSIPQADACRALLAHADLVSEAKAALECLDSDAATGESGWRYRAKVADRLRAAIARAEPPHPGAPSQAVPDRTSEPLEGETD